MKYKKIVSLLLAVIVITSTSPIRANAEVKNKSGTDIVSDFSPELGKMKSGFRKEDWAIKLADSYRLVQEYATFGTSTICIQKEGDDAKELDKEALTVEECLKLVTVLNSAINNNNDLGAFFKSKKDIPKWFFGQSPDVSNPSVEK